MKKLVAVIFWYPCILWAQMHDNTWLFGNKSDTILDNDRGIQILTFPDGKLKIEQNTQLKRFNFSETNSSFSDSSGRILTFSNAVHIGNSAWEIMENGEFLTNALEAGGELYAQWFLILPYPGQPKKLLYFYEQETFTSVLSFYASKLLYGSIDLSANSNLGKVTERDLLLMEDTLAVGKISAIKHANGRDWWVFVNEKHSNRYHRFMVTPNGIQLVGNQTIGSKVVDGVGQSAFSPNGEHYFIYGTVSASQGAYIDLYDFDRCTGLFYNHRQYHFTSNGWGGGAFSPNSRFLYINFFTKAYQYDLDAPDVWASQLQIAEYDGHLDPFNTTFYMMQLAPDGKIYGSSTGSVSSLHVIHSPDKAGLDCQYQQHGIELPTRNTFSIPTFPNYRLGPIDGSVCDSLGINNLPISSWRSELDSIDLLSATFQDLSYYQPTTWSWNFGDPDSGLNNTSTERHPAHLFSAAGQYEVCLTVSNTYANNTLCRTLKVGAVAAQDPDISGRIQISPNPFRNHLDIALSTTLGNPVFRLYDQMGRLVRQESLVWGVRTVETSGLPSGLYYWIVRAAGGLNISGTCVKTTE